MKAEFLQLVILLNGNFISTVINAEQKQSFTDMLAMCMTKPTKEVIYIGDAYFKRSGVIGFYFAPAKESVYEKIANNQEKVIKMMEKEAGGESWKSEGE